MNVKLQPNMTQNARDLKICSDYWAFTKNGGYIKYVNSLCQKYSISPQILFETIAQCFAYLDDVRCEYCCTICPLEVPADIPYLRAKDSWCCEVCEHATWQEHNHR